MLSADTFLHDSNFGRRLLEGCSYLPEDEDPVRPVFREPIRLDPSYPGGYPSDVDQRAKRRALIIHENAAARLKARQSMVGGC